MNAASLYGACGALVLGAAALPVVFLSGCGIAADPGAPARAADTDRTGEPTTAMRKGAEYNGRGELLRPADHREWIFVGAPVTPNDLNDGQAAFPEFHNVYIDPAGFAAYKKTGRFADGTVILKELVSVGGKALTSGNG